MRIKVSKGCDHLMNSVGRLRNSPRFSIRNVRRIWSVMAEMKGLIVAE